MDSTPPIEAKIRYRCDWCKVTLWTTAGNVTVGIDNGYGWFTTTCGNCDMPYGDTIETQIVEAMERGGCQVADAML